jgi:phosphatidylglycerophosphatase A
LAHLPFARLPFARLIASGFGCGLLPAAPGTAGSAAAVLSGALLMQLPHFVLPVAVLAATLGGLWAVRAAHGGDDPGWVVIDEVAGQWLALVGLARASFAGLLAAFLIFRVLDIAKPGPIGWADRQHGAAGVMADDLIAGAITAGILWAIGARWPELLR